MVRREDFTTVRSWSLTSPRIGPGRALRGVVLSCAVTAALTLPALAQDGGDKAAGDKGTPIKLQLNKAETAGDACRVTMVIDNSHGGAFKTYKVDLFAFDTEGVAQKRVAVELGPIPARKTTVKIFDFAGITCGKIGRVLLNDVLSCEGEMSRDSCLERTETESKASIPFDR